MRSLLLFRGEGLARPLLLQDSVVMTVALGLLWSPKKAAHMCSTTAAAASIQIGPPFIDVNLNLPVFGIIAGLEGSALESPFCNQ
jgi:hypothetical protein